ncbi:MAG: hypothetical protein JRE23_08110 [Deltaproteobacteria bacterium]|nr:hypothetical protein [Deltaproteobacteria bacterium]
MTDMQTLTKLNAIIDRQSGSEEEGTTTTANLYAGTATSGSTGADIVTISTSKREKLHSLLVNISNCTSGASISIRLYTKTLNAGSMEKFYDQDFTKDSDPDILPIIDGALAIRNDVRIEMQSDNASDTSLSVEYSYILEGME